MTWRKHWRQKCISVFLTLLCFCYVQRKTNLLIFQTIITCSWQLKDLPAAVMQNHYCSHTTCDNTALQYNNSVNRGKLKIACNMHLTKKCLQMDLPSKPWWWITSYPGKVFKSFRILFICVGIVTPEWQSHQSPESAPMVAVSGSDESSAQTGAALLSLVPGSAPLWLHSTIHFHLATTNFEANLPSALLYTINCKQWITTVKSEQNWLWYVTSTY